MDKSKALTLRIMSVIMLIFGFVFGITLKKTGYCFGDEVFILIGLNPWSGDGTGTHYPGVIGILFILAALGVFSYTTKDMKRTFRIFIVTAVIVIISLNIINV